MDRIAALRAFVDQRPDDPFPRYGLALELAGAGDHVGAWSQFEVLLERFPDYVPSYLMAGGTLVALERRSEAVEVYRRGIEAAGRAGDGHARGELEAALAEIADV